MNTLHFLFSSKLKTLKFNKQHCDAFIFHRRFIFNHFALSETFFNFDRALHFFKASYAWVLFLFIFKVFILYWNIADYQGWNSVSREQQQDSAIHIHMFILPQTPLPSRLPHDIEQTSLGWPAGPCWFSMLNTAMCPRPSRTP